MSYMSIKKKNVSFKEICDIINLCSNQRVLHLKWEGVELHFVGDARTEKPIINNSNQDFSMDVNQVDISDELDVKDRALAELHITDPLLYEEMVARGELAG
jgi:hypothetical protein